MKKRRYTILLTTVVTALSLLVECAKPDRSEEATALKNELQDILFTNPEQVLARVDSAERSGVFSETTANLIRSNVYGQTGQTQLAILQRADISWSVQHLDHYSLSVCLYKDALYNADLIGAGADIKSNIGTGYEQCTFHKLTGWGNFLRINAVLPWGNPTSGGGGPIE